MSERTLAPPPSAPPGHPIVDVHVHVGASDSGEVYYPELPGQEWLDLAAAAGVVVGCAFPPYRLDGYRAANAGLRDWAATTAGRVLAFARIGGPVVPLAQWPPRPWQVRRRISPHSLRRPSDLPGSLDGFSGVKLLPHLDGLPRPEEFEQIADRRLPVLVHSGRFVPPGWVARRVLPRTTGPVVLGHLGAFPHEERMLTAALELAREHPRLYLETSGIWDSSFLQRAAAAVPDKLLFGSDAPLTTPAVAWQHVASAVLDPAVLRRMAVETPSTVLGLPLCDS